jgi:peroxiredoxin
MLARLLASIVLCALGVSGGFVAYGEEAGSERKEEAGSERPAAGGKDAATKPPVAAKPAEAKPAAKPESPANEDEAGLPAGHSWHGEAFNEGPRQAAYLMPGTGKVSFPVSSKVPQVQEFVNQGVGQLHGFWYFEAERTFRQAAALDPDCAIAYWGMAMANTNNEKRAAEFISEAVKRKSGVSPRERLWIEALNDFYHGKLKGAARKRQYVRQLENIVHEFPKDLEAKAFLVVTIWGNSNYGPANARIPLSSHEAIDALAAQVLAVEPNHPVLHYRIHLWDEEKAARALNSAALCGPSSPTIAHMWHMPGHTYSKLNRYADAAWQQEASSRVDHAHMIRDHVLPDQIHNYAHNEEWLIRDLMFLGQAHRAIDLAKNLIEMPRHPKFNLVSGTGTAHYGRMRLMECLERCELWDEALALAKTPYLEPTDDVRDETRRLKLLAVASFMQGDSQHGKEHLAALEALLKKSQAEPAKPKTEVAAKDKDAKDQPAQDSAAKKDEASAKKPPVAKGANEKGDAEKSRKDERKDLEAAIAMARGYQALAAADYNQALVQFEKSGTAAKGLLSRVQLLAGKKDKAEQLAREAVASGKNQFLPLANQVDILWQLDKRAEANKAFDQLRTVAATADLDLPICQRLQPIVRERGLPADWRQSPPTPDDLGPRPALDTLGPWRWEPFFADAWQLPDSNGKQVSLANYRGKPVILLFYLGFGCVHCMEQLQAFSPLTDEFAQAGISLLGIGTDSVEDLRDSLAHPPKGRSTIKFPLLADDTLDTFRAYRAYDDFEEQPLHATLLVDGAGRVLWQEISYEPFTNARFLLKESQRLLGQGVAQRPTSAPAPSTRSEE